MTAVVGHLKEKLVQVVRMIWQELRELESALELVLVAVFDETN